MYNESSVVAAVDILNDAIIKSINLAVPIGTVSKHNYPAWFSSTLRTYIKKKNYFTGVTKSTRLTVTTKNSPFVGN